MFHFSVDGKTVSVFPSAEPGAPVIYLNTSPGEDRQVFQAMHRSGCPEFTLAAISDLDWNCDLVPWDHPPVFRNTLPFTGGADRYLDLLTGSILPEAEKRLSGPPRWRGIAGYSLAGLFAVYSICQTDVFTRVGCISGSLWFPGIKEYLFSHGIKARPECMYFSLGSKENKSRNPVLNCVRQNTQEIQAFFQRKGIDTAFELNPGNHYNLATQRTCAGIRWLLSR